VIGAGGSAPKHLTYIAVARASVPQPMGLSLAYREAGFLQSE
jgi:hypothetical protein